MPPHHDNDSQEAAGRSVVPEAPSALVDSDAQLAAMARHGNKHAFCELVSRYKSRVFGMAAKYTRNHHELDDLAQEIFIRCWKGLGKFRGDAPFEHWLMRLAVRACYTFLRRHRWRREHEVSRDALLEADPGAAEGVSPHAPAAENPQLVQLRAALAQLPAKDRLVITLLEIEDRPVREIAALTGWSEGNVKVRAHRAREKLKQLLHLKT